MSLLIGLLIIGLIISAGMFLVQIIVSVIIAILSIPLSLFGLLIEKIRGRSNL